VIVRVALALALASCLAVAGCGGDGGDGGGGRRVELLLDFFPNADHAGIYAADANGHFRREALDVRVRAPADPADPIRRVAAGRTDLAISYEPEVLRARDQDLPVVSVAAIVRKPLTSIISLPDGDVRTPADLRGKRVGTAGIDYQSAYLEAILARAGVPRDSVEERNIGFNFSAALLAGRVDATLGAFWNYEGTQLRLEGKDPRIIRMEEVGVPTYDELVLVANEDRLPELRDTVRRLLRALERGTRDLERDPEGGVDALLEANRDLDPRLQREAVRVTLPLFLPPRGKPFGYQDPREWREFTRFMRENDLIAPTQSERGAFTNELLPGRGG
jgi:putative hydroxymethylpyrimidine transport system substrate-binding protein